METVLTTDVCDLTELDIVWDQGPDHFLFRYLVIRLQMLYFRVLLGCDYVYELFQSVDKNWVICLKFSCF